MALNTFTEFYKSARLVSASSRKTVIRQVYECLNLYFGKGKISPSEYYYFQLFNDQVLSWSDKKEFIGWRFAVEIDKKLNAHNSHIVSSDKLLFYNLLNGLNLPHPKIYAVAHPTGRICASGPCMNSEDELAKFIRDEITFPFFSKPIHGSFGAGSYLINEYDRKNDELIIADGRRIPLVEFSKLCTRESTNNRRLPGQIFQEALTAHPVINSICGPNISGVRIIVLMADSGPMVLRAIWKVIVGQNFVDNYNEGKTGNLLGDVCLKSGRVKNVITGVGLDKKLVHAHPDTGVVLADVFLPDWQETLDLCITASTIAPTLRFQHWDVALTSDGPRLLELNINGSVDLPQLAGFRGLYDARFKNAVGL